MDAQFKQFLEGTFGSDNPLYVLHRAEFDFDHMLKKLQLASGILEMEDNLQGSEIVGRLKAMHLAMDQYNSTYKMAEQAKSIETGG